MKWYYAPGTERHGPVDSEALLSLVEQGTVKEDSLVWREGLPQWVPLAQVRAELSGAAPAGPLAACVECGESFPAAEMVQVKGMNICLACKPVFLQKLSQGLAPGGQALWRKGKELVAGKEAVFPPRCLKCNAPAEGPQLPRKLYWHHPALYLMIFFPGILFYAIVAMLVRKQATVAISLCGVHRRRRRRFILAAWLLFLGGIAVIIAAANLAKDDLLIIGVFTGIAMILAGLVTGIMGSRTLIPKRIDDRHLHAGGAGPEFLSALPEWVEH